MILAAACASDGNRVPEGAPTPPAPGLPMPPPVRSSAEPQPSSEQVPIDPDDGVWGSADAPVTVVVFTDLECPYCAEGHATLSQLARHFGPSRLRFAIKHCPLAMHPQAIPAARVAQAVLEIGGRGKFFAYVDRAYADPNTIAQGGMLTIASALGLDVDAVRELAASRGIGEQIVADVELANRLGVAATPHFRVNGLGLTGALPFSTLEPVVRAELAAAEALRKKGVAPNGVYARRVAENVTRPAP